MKRRSDSSLFNELDVNHIYNINYSKHFVKLFFRNYIRGIFLVREEAERQKREELALELETNKELEAEVQKWKDYRDKGMIVPEKNIIIY